MITAEELIRAIASSHLAIPRHLLGVTDTNYAAAKAEEAAWRRRLGIDRDGDRRPERNR